MSRSFLRSMGALACVWLAACGGTDPDDDLRDSAAFPDGDSSDPGDPVDTDVDQPPVLAGPVVLVLPEDTVAQGTIPVTDPEGAPLTWTLVTAPSHGAVSGVLPDITYTPDPDYFGPDAAFVQVSDGVNTLDVDVALTVTPVDDEPTASGDPVVVDEDASAPVVVSARPRPSCSSPEARATARHRSWPGEVAPACARSAGLRAFRGLVPVSPAARRPVR